MGEETAGILERRLELELRLHNLDEKLVRLQEWAPLAKDPRATVRSLNEKRAETIEELRQLPDSREIEPRMGDFGDPVDPRDPRWRSALFEGRLLEALVRRRSGTRPTVATSDGTPDSCPSLLGVVWAYRHQTYQLAHVGDADVGFSFDPYENVTQGALRFSAIINNPALYDWPIVEEYKPAYLVSRAAALEFDLPAHWCAHPGGWYDVVLRLSLNGRLSGESAFFRVVLIKYVEAPISGQVTIDSFEADAGRRLQYAVDFGATDISTISQMGLFDHYMWLTTDEPTRVHIGIWVYASSIAANVNVTGALMVDPYPGEDVWGLRYQINAGP